MKVGIFCDCHNTLMNSNEAWIKAFAEYAGMDKAAEIELYLYGKFKRRELAKKYKIEFAEIERSADKYIEKKDNVIDILEIFKMVGVPLFVVSNAPRYRVMKDLEITGLTNLFQEIFTGDEGGKQNNKIFNELFETYKLERGFFIGNDEFDDYIYHEKITSLILADFLRIRHRIIGSYQMDEKGMIQNKF